MARGRERISTTKLNAAKDALATFRAANVELDPQQRLTVTKRFGRYQRSMSDHELTWRVNTWAARENMDPEILRSKRGPQALTKTRALLIYELYCFGASYRQLESAFGGRNRAMIQRLIVAGRGGLHVTGKTDRH